MSEVLTEKANLSAEEQVRRLEELVAEAAAGDEAPSSILELRRQLAEARRIAERVRRAAEAVEPAGSVITLHRDKGARFDWSGGATSEGVIHVDRVFTETFASKLPGYEVREPQLDMARLVAKTLAENRHAIIEAGTGTGKSFAYLVPAVRHAQERGRIVISTGTIALQEQLIFKDIPFLQQVLDEPFTAVLVKGRSNYLCRLRLDKEVGAQSLFAEQNADDPELRPILEWLAVTETGDKTELPFVPGQIWSRVCGDDECPKKKCRHFGDCFILKARALAEHADLIVCNHHLFFADLKVRLVTDDMASILPEHGTVVFDEGHHVADVAIEAFGDECSEHRAPSLIRDARKAAPSITAKDVEDLERQNRLFFDALLNPEEKSDRYKLRVHPDSGPLRTALRRLGKALEDEPYATDEDDDRGHKLATRAETIAAAIGAMLDPERENEDYVAWVEVERKGDRRTVTLHGTPVDVSGRLREHLFGKLDSVILTSATMAAGGNFAYQKRLLGLDNCLELNVGSPFDYSKQCLVYCPSWLPDPRDEKFTAALIDEVRDILEATSGRAFVLFTSYQQLNQVYEALRWQLPYTPLKQGDRPRSRLVEEFKRLGNAVLFATSSFWEGIDVQGEALSCVILAKLPFSVPTEPITEAKIRAIERRGGNPFIEHSVPEACLRLKQGAGRLIRTRRDRGLLAILDPRVLTKPYGSAFIHSLPGGRWITDLAAVGAFLGGAPR